MVKQGIGSLIVKTIIRFPLIIWSLLVLYPIFWMFTGAFKTNGEIYASPWSLPTSFSLDNFINAWAEYNIGSSFFNSLFVTVFGTFLCIVLSVPTSYAIDRIKFKGSTWLFNIYISAMMIPMVLGWIPLFFLLLKFNMLDNLWALSLVYAVTQIPFSIFILTSFMGTVPKELEEAAAIDGMTPYGILLKIVTPLISTGIITVSIMNAVTFWNEYFMALIFLQTEGKFTLGLAMDFMNKEAQYTNAWGELFAGLTIAIIPIMIMYAIFQRRITQGLTEGAIKG